MHRMKLFMKFLLVIIFVSSLILSLGPSFTAASANGLTFQIVNDELRAPGDGDSYEPDNSSGEANLIESGTPQTHSISPAGDEDWVIFTLVFESEVTLETSGPSGDTLMMLYDSNVSEIEYDDDGGTDSFSYIDRICGVDALPEGTYYVSVEDYANDDEIASYDLSFNATPCSLIGDSYEPDNSAGEANPITSGSPQTHSIVPVGDEDWVTFTLPSNAGITLETTGASGGDTRMWLYNSSLIEIDFDDDSGTDWFSYIDRVCGVDALPAGTYYVQVDEYYDDAQISFYDISLITTPCPAHQNFLPLVIKASDPGTVLNGNFELGHTGWTESSSSADDLITQTLPVSPHSGTWLAQFGLNNNETDQLSQSVFIPADKTDLYYWYRVLDADSFSDYDFFYVRINGTPIKTITLFDDTITMGWVEDVVDLSAYAGSFVTLMFEVTTDDEIPSELYLDDVSLQSPSS